MTKFSRRDPHGWRRLTRVNSINVLDEGLRIGGRPMTKDFGIEIGTQCTQVHVPVVEDCYIAGVKLMAPEVSLCVVNDQPVGNPKRKV
jgi:hypothetical protein